MILKTGEVHITGARVEDVVVEHFTFDMGNGGRADVEALLWARERIDAALAALLAA